MSCIAATYSTVENVPTSLCTSLSIFPSNLTLVCFSVMIRISTAVKGEPTFSAKCKLFEMLFCSFLEFSGYYCTFTSIFYIFQYFVMDDFGGPPHLQGPSPTLRLFLYWFGELDWSTMVLLMMWKELGFSSDSHNYLISTFLSSINTLHWTFVTNYFLRPCLLTFGL